MTKGERGTGHQGEGGQRGQGKQGAQVAGEGHGGRQGKGGHKNRGRQRSQEQEVRHKGTWVQEGIPGHRFTRQRGEAGGGEVSSQRFPHHRTQRSCGCNPPINVSECAE